MVKRTYNRGFTLLEVLVVAAIIGILSAVIYANFSGVRSGAQNDQLRTELKQVQLALELYKAQNGTYPIDCSVMTCPPSGQVGTITGNCANGRDYLPGLAPNFIEELPDACDFNPGCYFLYQVDKNGGSFYKLTAKNCVQDHTMDPNDELAMCPAFCGGTGDCSFDFNTSMAVYNKGWECH